MTKSSNIYLREAIETLVFEVLGKFNLSYFKRLSGEHKRHPDERNEYGRTLRPWEQASYNNPEGYFPEVAYAKQTLPLLGKGSSRITFALSGGKALKIAINEAGQAQNKEEVAVFEKTKGNDLFTKVFDKDEDGKWIIAELVKPLDTKNTGQTLVDLVGLSLNTIMDLTSYLGRFDIQTSLARIIDSRYAELNSFYQGDPAAHEYKKEIKTLEDMLKNPEKQKLLNDIKHAIQLGINMVDVRDENLGRTVDGQIKILDYGYSNKVMRDFY